MAQNPLGPPPFVKQEFVFDRWMRLLWERVVKSGQILWGQLDFTGSNLTDLATRNHADLQNLNTANYTHLTETNHTDLTDGGDSALHYHATDRDLANATGTLAVANGGTGQSSYTDGQLLIGNSTGNTLTKATLTAGSNITITNGGGSITIASSSPSDSYAFAARH